tara:strand:+ start:1117 stop:1971 length:855 start_codon:yes stop_codon:yes gene_type:complete
MKPNFYFHLGYPKCVSTSLQRCFFSCHPQINYFGIGKEDNISYLNEDIEFIFEVLLKYSRRSFYSQNKDFYQRRIKESLSDKKVNLVSNEHLLMNFTLQGIDPDEKLERLRELFQGFNMTAIVIYREDSEKFLYSLYKEICKMGYFAEPYSNFKDWIEKFQDRNFKEDIDHEKKIKNLSNYFDRVETISFESIVHDEICLNEYFSKLLKIKNKNLAIENKNISITDNDLKNILQEKNDKHRAKFFESFESHRNRTLFKKLKLDLPESEIYEHVINKRNLNKKND